MTVENPPKNSPPGLIMGPDGKPCKPCNSFRTWSKAQRAAQQPSGGKGGASTAAAGGTLAALGAAAAATTSSSDPRANCPADVEQLGRATWTFLHTTAAYYPERPSPAQRTHMLGLLNSLPVLYPCSHCASHLGECMKANPPDVTGRGSLSRWLCERHNEVNEMLGKEKFDCAKTDERWKDGPADGSCD